MSAPPDRDLLVIGAGISGLSAAWWAARSGKSVTVLEASGRVGGVIRTDLIGGYRVERAAAAFPSTAEQLLQLHASLPNPPPIHAPPAEANRQFLLTSRGLVALPRSPLSFLRSPLLAPGSKVRIFVEALRGPRRARTPESAHQFVRRRFGIAAAERFLKPMTLGIYGSHPGDLGLADAFPALATMERQSGSILRALPKRRGSVRRELRTFEGGMESFPRAIAEALGDSVVRGAPVASLRPIEGGVEAASRDGATWRAREVLLATTADAQARFVAPFSAAAAGLLDAVRYVPMVVAAVGIPPGGAPDVPKAFGFLRSPGSRARILGASIPSVLNSAVAPGGHTLLSVFLGGGQDPGAIDLDDDDVRRVVLRDLSAALGGPVRPDMVDVCRWPRAIPVFSPGHLARMAAANRLLAPFGVRLSGSHVSGVGIHSCCVPPP